MTGQNLQNNDAIVCPTCATENRREATFCRECGQRLCIYCGFAVGNNAKFCPDCGEELAPPPHQFREQTHNERSHISTKPQATLRNESRGIDSSSQGVRGAVITGRIRNLQSQQITRGSTVPQTIFILTFIVDVFDQNGDVTQSVPIEMRRNAKRLGFINDGDEVELFDSPMDGKTLLVTKLYDATKRTWIEGESSLDPPQPFWVKILIIPFVLIFAIVFVLVFGSILFSVLMPMIKHR
jgi:hypothetical protein